MLIEMLSGFTANISMETQIQQNRRYTTIQLDIIHTRLRLYREAAKEAEDIFDRWADEIDDLDEDFMEDEDYEPDEYYSD